MAFGMWLVGQQQRVGWVGELAATAAKDPRFPRGGDPDDARRHLTAMGAEGDVFEALDDAEAAWLRAIR